MHDYTRQNPAYRRGKNSLTGVFVLYTSFPHIIPDSIPLHFVMGVTIQSVQRPRPMEVSMVRTITSILLALLIVVLSDSRVGAFTEAQLIKYYGLKEAEICVRTKIVKQSLGKRKRECALYRKVRIPTEKAQMLLPKEPNSPLKRRCSSMTAFNRS